MLSAQELNFHLLKIIRHRQSHSAAFLCKHNMPGAASLVAAHRKAAKKPEVSAFETSSVTQLSADTAKLGGAAV